MPRGMPFGKYRYANRFTPVAAGAPARPVANAGITSSSGKATVAPSP